MTVNVFSVPVFFVVFRETLETAIIVATLLAFLKQTLDGPERDVVTYKKLVRQVGHSRQILIGDLLILSKVWLGAGCGLLVWYACRTPILILYSFRTRCPITIHSQDLLNVVTSYAPSFYLWNLLDLGY